MATVQEIDAQIAALQAGAGEVDSRGGRARINKQIAALNAQKRATQNMTIPAADLEAQIAAARVEVDNAHNADQRGWSNQANAALNALLATKKSRDASALLANPAGASPAQIWAARQVVSPIITAAEAAPDGDGGRGTTARAKAQAAVNAGKTQISDEQAALADAHAAQNTPQWQAVVNAYNTGQQVPDEFVPLLNRLNAYYQQGQAAPGNLGPATAGEALRQWGIDAQPGGFEKFMNVAVPLAFGALTGGVGGIGAIGGLTGVGAAAAGGAVAGGISSGMQGGGLGDIAKGALTGGALGYGGGMLADYAGAGSTAADATSAGMSTAELAAADPYLQSMAAQGANVGVTAGQGAMTAQGVIDAATAANTATGMANLTMPGLQNAAADLGSSAWGAVPPVGVDPYLSQMANAGYTGLTTMLPQDIPQLPNTPPGTPPGTPPTTPGDPNMPGTPSDLLKTVAQSAPTWMDYLSTGLGLVQGVQGVMGGNSQDAGAAQRAMDPFAPYRAQYAQQLNQLMADPSSVTSLPGYQFQQQQGQQAVERTLAAQGRTVSGQEQIELQKYGQGQAGQYYNDQYNKLAQLSGASTSPALGGQAFNQATAGNQAQQQAGWSGLTQLAGQAVTPGTSMNRATTGVADYLTGPNAFWR